MALPGNAHGQGSLVVVAGQGLQRSAARGPGVEKYQQLQVWRQQGRERVIQHGTRTGLKEKTRMGGSGLLTGTVAVLLQLSVLRWYPWGAARG